MGQVLWRTKMGDRILEVALTGSSHVDIASDVDPLELGPVGVRRVVAGVEEDLGVADTVADALETWDELRELGDDVECTCAGDPSWFSDFLYGKVRLAPPQGWVDLPRTLGGFEINGEWFELNLQDVPWEEVASIGGEYVGFILSYLDGWLQQLATDMDDEYRWAGPDPDLEAEGWDLVLGPPMWPTGSELDVRLSFVTDPTAPEVVSEFVTPSITEMHSYIVLNGVTIYSREDDPEHEPPSDSGRQLLDARRSTSSVPALPALSALSALSALPALPDLRSSRPDRSDETIDVLRRDLDEAIAGAAPAEEVEQIRAELGSELLQAGYAEEAIGYLENAAESAAERLGADDEEVLNLRGILGRALTEASLFERAEQVLLGVVAGRTRTLGPDDPQTLVARGNLLRAIGRGGRPEEALAMADALLEDRLRLLGPDHPSTLDTRGHRAQLLSEAGRDAEAVAEMESLLADRIRVLGESDPVVASTRHNLAAVRSRSRSSDGVDSWWELQQNAVAVSDELGPDHPETLVAWGLVAEQLQRLGRDAEALALLERLVEARTRVLGPDANQTLISRRMMCTSQRRLGDVRQALTGAEELEELAIASVGPTSPLVQQIRMELIDCLRTVMDDGGTRDPSLTARLEELMDQIAEPDPELGELDGEFSMLLQDPEDRPGEGTY